MLPQGFALCNWGVILAQSARKSYRAPLAIIISYFQYNCLSASHCHVDSFTHNITNMIYSYRVLSCIRDIFAKVFIFIVIFSDNTLYYVSLVYLFAIFFPFFILYLYMICRHRLNSSTTGNMYFHHEAHIFAIVMQWSVDGLTSTTCEHYFCKGVKFVLYWPGAIISMVYNLVSPGEFECISISFFLYLH